MIRKPFVDEDGANADGRTIELTGSACQDWRLGDAGLDAVFPCDVVVVE